MTHLYGPACVAQLTINKPMTMFKFRLICTATGILYAAGGTLAAEEVTKQGIPVFAPTARIGWVLDRSFGVDDLLPSPTGRPGPVTFDKAYPYVPNGSAKPPTYRVADLSQPNPAALDDTIDEEGE